MGFFLNKLWSFCVEHNINNLRYTNIWIIITVKKYFLIYKLVEHLKLELNQSEKSMTDLIDFLINVCSASVHIILKEKRYFL